jgi:hypothetical protein
MKINILFKINSNSISKNVMSLLPPMSQGVGAHMANRMSSKI